MHGRFHLWTQDAVIKRSQTLRARLLQSSGTSIRVLTILGLGIVSSTGNPYFFIVSRGESYSTPAGRGDGILARLIENVVAACACTNKK